MSKKVVYITGCFGFIGSYITRACLDKGWEVRGIDKMTYASNIKNLDTSYLNSNHFTFDKIDINDVNHIYECDYIINCAAETHVDNSIAGSKVFLESNINGVYNLLETIRKKGSHKPPIFLHLSTDEVYGDCMKCAHKEIDTLKPSNPYSATKAAGDHLITSWHRTYGLPYLIVRPTNNYGIGQYPEKLIPRTIKHFNLGKKIELHNNGTPIRTWLHAQDTADAVTMLIEKGIKNETFNISGGIEKTNIEVVHHILQNYLDGRNYKIDDYVDFSYGRPGQDIRYSLDDSKIRGLGWKPKKDFNIEITKIVNYYKEGFIW